MNPKKCSDQLQAVTSNRLQSATPLYIYPVPLPEQLEMFDGEANAPIPYRLRIKQARQAAAKRRCALKRAATLAAQHPNVIAFQTRSPK